MKKTIVIFSNPFGFGPTSHALSLMTQLLKTTQNAEIIFAGSGLCMEMFANIRVKKFNINERNIDEVEDFLKKIENPHVLACQNKFCVIAAKRLGIPCAYLDILAWFWNEIPDDHFLADNIFWINFPEIERRVPVNAKNIHIVSGIVDPVENILPKKNQLLVHIGGAKYPYTNEIQKPYLELLVKGLDILDSIKEDILIAGGRESMEFIKQIVKNKKVYFRPLSHEEFIAEISQSAKIFTVAGVSSTLESFSSGAVTSFLLPINLAHMSLIDILRKQKISFSALDWDKYITVDPSLRVMDEKRAISELDSYARNILDNQTLLSAFLNDFKNMAKSSVVHDNQRDLIKQIGSSGAREVVDILIKKWSI